MDLKNISMLCCGGFSRSRCCYRATEAQTLYRASGGRCRTEPSDAVQCQGFVPVNL